MRTIWKYELEPETIINVPVDAKPLAVQVQGGQTCLWVLLDPDTPRVERKFLSFGTGHPIPDDSRFQRLQYIDTFQTENPMKGLINSPTLVFHVFEEIR